MNKKQWLRRKNWNFIDIQSKGKFNRKMEKKLACGLEDMDNTKQVIVACKGGMVKAEICHEKGESWDPAWRKA